MNFVAIEDAREAARRRLPRMFFDYIDGGSTSEATLRANSADFARWNLRQRVLRDVTARDLSTSFLGRRHALPFALAPVGFLGLFAGSGEILAARAAHAAGIAACLSTFSIVSLAQLRRATPGPLYFQLYILDDEAFLDELLSEAEKAGVEALFLTVDTAMTSVREREVRSGFRATTQMTPGLLARLALKPGWCLDMLKSGMPQVGAVAHRPEYGAGILAQAANLSRRIDQSLSWARVAWLRRRWAGRLVLKGIMEAEDARIAADHGVEAIVVSNHGGRQLDGAASTVTVLPEIAAAVGSRIEVLVDSGFRRGADIAKALALGATGVLLGRAYAYALAGRGEAGVAQAIALLARDLDVTLALMGIPSVDALKAMGAEALR